MAYLPVAFGRVRRLRDFPRSCRCGHTEARRRFGKRSSYRIRPGGKGVLRRRAEPGAGVLQSVVSEGIKAKLRAYAHLRDIDALTPEPGFQYWEYGIPGYGCAVYGRANRTPIAVEYDYAKETRRSVFMPLSYARR